MLTTLKSNALPIAVLSLVASISGAALAQGATLFSYANPPKIEALGAKENTRLSQIKSIKSTASTTFIKLDPAALNNNILKISLPDGTQVTLINSRRETPLPDIDVWSGRSKEIPAWGTFTFNKATKNVTGKFSALGKIYTIEPYGPNAYVLVLVDTSGLPAHAPNSTQDEKKTLALSSAKSAAVEGAVKAPAASQGPIIIDILVAYTPKARVVMANPADVVGQEIAFLNSALANSVSANVQVRLVDLFEVPLNDAGSQMPTMVTAFSSLDVVASRRKSSGADVMILLTGDDPISSGCGHAQSIGANSSTAYAAVNATCMMRYVTFEHEFGHLLGAHHELTADPSGISYAHGYVLNYEYYYNGRTHSHCQKTIVTTEPVDCEVLLSYSNPSVTNIRDMPLGNAGSAYNGRIIAESAPIVANFNLGAGSAAQAAKQRRITSTVTSFIRSFIEP